MSHILKPDVFIKLIQFFYFFILISTRSSEIMLNVEILREKIINIIKFKISYFT